MPTGEKFNNADGDEHQQKCQARAFEEPFCRLDEPAPTKEKQPFDVYFVDEGGGRWRCTKGKDTCEECEEIEKHVNP